MIKHIIWDWNGTLVDDVELCVDILNRLLSDYGKNIITVDRYRSSFFFPVAKFYESLTQPSLGSKYDNLAKAYIKEYRERFKECFLHTGAVKTLKQLNAIGISHSLLSAGMQEDLEKFTRFYGIHKWMSQIDGADNIEARGKEDRVLKHFSSLKLPPDQVLFVGDTLHDWEVADLVGCKILLFEGGHFDVRRFKETKMQTIKSLREVSTRVSG